MINNQTVNGIKQTVAMMVDNVVTSNMFNDSFWIEIINEATSYIYGYHKWSWTIKDETITVANSTTVQLTFPVQEIIKVYVGTDEYVQVDFFEEGVTNVFRLDGDTLILNKAMDTDIRVVYRRWFKEYTLQDGGKKIDLPFYLNGALISLMQFKILPIWLGEGSGGLMNNYMQDAINQLERYKMIDTYAESERGLYPKRR